MNRLTVGILQFVLVLGLLVLYATAPNYIDSSFIGFSILAAMLSLFFRSLQFEKRRLLSRNPFTITNFFILSYCITLFQIPLEYLLNTLNDNRFHHLFYDYSIINKSILFSAICLVIFNFGQTLIKDRGPVTMVQDNATVFLINSKPFLLITISLFFLHIITVERGYYFGGNESLTGLSLIVHGYLMRFIVIFVFIIVWNSKQKVSIKSLNILGYLKIFPIYFLVLISVLCLLTLFAGDRGPIIRIVLVMVFGYFVLSQRKVNYISFFILIITSGFVLSIVKLIGGYSGDVGYVESFSVAQERFNTSDRIESISPYTVELASSIYSNAILFSLWSSGVSLYGIGLFTGVLMAVPAGVTFFSELTGLAGESINSAVLATIVSGQDYGVGTTVVGDALINFGFFGAMLCFLFLGGIMRKLDVNIYNDKLDFKWTLLAFVLIADIIILPRSSMYTLVGVYIFDYAIISIILVLMKAKRKYS